MSIQWPALAIAQHPQATTFASEKNPQLVLQQLITELSSGKFPASSEAFRKLLADAGRVSLWFYLKFICGYAGPYSKLNTDLHVDMCNYRQRLLKPGVKGAILVPRSSYKCLEVNTPVMTSSGIKLARDIVPGDALYQWNGSKVVATDVQATKIESSLGVRVQFRSGRVSTVASGHMFTDGENWFTTDELGAGDPIALGIIPGAARDGSDESWCVGVIYGDGGLTGGSVRVTLADKELVEKFNSIKPLSKPRGKYGYDVVMGVRWWKELGLPFSKSIDKEFPYRYLGDAAFLRGLFDTDGSVAKNGRIVLTSASKNLLTGVQNSLMLFGISSYVARYNQSASTNGCFYVLSIDAGRCTRIFEERIGFVHLGKKERLRLNNIRNPESKIRDVLPVQLWKSRIPKGGDPRNPILRIDNWYDMTWSKYSKLRGLFPNMPDWESLPIRWDRVESIENVGTIDVVHIQVGGEENYIGLDGLIHHNSTIASHGANSWELIRDPNLSIGCTSEIYDRAESFVKQTISNFSENDLHKWLYPEWSKANRTGDELILTNRTHRKVEPSLRAITAGGATAGIHVDLFDADDIVGEDLLNADRSSGADMYRLANWLHSNLRTLVVSWKESRVVVVGTRYGLDDPYERIMLHSRAQYGYWDEVDYPKDPKGEWETYYRPATQNGVSICPEAYDIDVLERLAEEDPWLKATQYDNNPLKAGISDFAEYTPGACELRYDDAQGDFELLFDDNYKVFLGSCDLVGGGDPAGGGKSQGPKSSKSAATVVARTPNDRIAIIEAISGYVEPTRFFDWLSDFQGKYTTKLRVTYVEAVAGFKAMVKLLQVEARKRNLRAPSPVPALGEKESTIRAVIQPWLARGKLYLRKEIRSKVMEELKIFPSSRMDLLDAIKIAIFKTHKPAEQEPDYDDDDDERATSVWGARKKRQRSRLHELSDAGY